MVGSWCGGIEHITLFLGVVFLAFCSIPRRNQYTPYNHGQNHSFATRIFYENTTGRI
jgi:hypothetical protein